MNAGIDLRYQKTKAYDDYFFEPANVWDLTKDINYVDVYNATAFYDRFVGQPVPGWPDRYATQGVINGDTNDSNGTTEGSAASKTGRSFSGSVLNHSFRRSPPLNGLALRAASAAPSTLRSSWPFRSASTAR